MNLLTQSKLTFAAFLDFYPDGQGIFELVNGAIVEMRATRGHDSLADALLFAFNDEIRRRSLNFKVTNKVVLRTADANGQEQGRNPDVSVIDKAQWEANPSAYSAFTEPIQLAVEVVSTNWEDDYVDKLDEYQRLRIVEYWIVDYLTHASRAYLGNPKVPTVFVHLLDESGQYQMKAYQGSDRILSPTFPDLNLTADTVLQGQIS